MLYIYDAAGSDTPPSVNSKPFLMSSVCGKMDPKVSVPIIASVLKSHTRIGNSVLSPKNGTMQDEHPKMLICEPFAPPYMKGNMLYIFYASFNNKNPICVVHNTSMSVTHSDNRNDASSVLNNS